jgi:hypothetical protein
MFPVIEPKISVEFIRYSSIRIVPSRKIEDRKLGLPACQKNAFS